MVTNSLGLLGNFVEKRTNLVLAAILIFGLVLRLVFFTGMGISDPLEYSLTAEGFESGIDPNAYPSLSNRLGIVAPTAFMYGIFGINDFTSVLFILLTSVAGIYLVYLFGKLIFSKQVGLLAAFLLSFFPLDALYASQLYSDIPSAFFMSLGVYLFLYQELNGRRSMFTYFLSGAIIGVGYFIRESALLIALFFIGYILYKKRIRKEYFLVPLGVLTVIILESFMFYSLTGDFLYRNSVSQEVLANDFAVHDYFGRLNFPEGLFHYPYIILSKDILLPFYIFMFISSLYVLMYRVKSAYSLLIWFYFLLGYLSLGTTSLTSYIPFRAVDRYLMIITIPGILLMSCFLLNKEKIMKNVMLPGAVILLLLLSLGSLMLNLDNDNLDDTRSAYGFLKSIEEPVYADSRTIKAINYVSSYENSIDLVEFPKSLEEVSGSYVVVNRFFINNIRAAHDFVHFPEQVDNIPGSWVLVDEFGNVEEDKLSIYYSPNKQ